MTKIISYLFSAILLLCLAHPALAQYAEPYQLGLQEPATPVAQRMYDFHNLLLYLITFIVVFVLGLLVYVVLKFNAKANPVPSTTTHNTPLEIMWTLIPTLILFAVAFPSFKLLYYADRISEPEMTLKVTGYQWYWGYEYPDHDGLSFLSYMIPDEEIDAEKGQIRNLSTDNVVVLPVDTNIQILITAEDVLHAFAVPAFGIKTDAVPGRLNETWVRIEKEGTYYGQCSELCGKAHAFMPIEIKAVSKEEFEKWLEKAKEEHA
ncbi:MAG: cytochrome c oxidase subunit II [Bdellovibrionales bacterium]